MYSIVVLHFFICYKIFTFKKFHLVGDGTYDWALVLTRNSSGIGSIKAAVAGSAVPMGFI